MMLWTSIFLLWGAISLSIRPRPKVVNNHYHYPTCDDDRDDWRTRRLIKSNKALYMFIATPPPKKWKVSEHGPIDMVNMVCLGCGRSLVELHNYEVVPPCKE